ncbi:MAG TPA: tetratricopeptide repeat protein [Gemmataceae bacterium]
MLTLFGVALAVGGINLWAWHHFREAGRLADRQRFAQAHAHFAHSLQVWRWSASTHFSAGRSARRAGLYAEAERHLAECQRLQGGSSVALALEHLLLRAQSGDVNAVEDSLWKYVEKNKPETPLVLEALARGYLRMMRAGAALRCLRMLLEREPDHIEALMMRAEIRQGNNDAREARADYARVLELDPERDDARLHLATNLLRNNPPEARAQFEYLLARQPNNLDVLLGLAQSRQALGELDEARALLEAVLAKDPENSKALTRLGTLILNDGKATESENLFRRAIAADPTNYEAHFGLYRSLAQQPGREEETDSQVALYERVKDDLARLGQIATKDMTRTPKDAKLHYELGAIYLRYGKPDVGVRWLYSALKLDPGDQRSHQALHEHFQRTGDKEKAEWHRLQLRPETAKPVAAQP